MEGYLRDHAPTLIEEMAGIAEGSGVSFADVFKHNLCSCIGTALSSEASVRETEHCTSIGFPNSNRGPLLGKNTDCGDPEMRGLSMFSLLEMRGLLTSIMCSNTIATQAIWLICCSMSSVVARMSARTRWVQSRACAGLFIRSPLRWGLSSLLFWGSANRSPTLRRRHGLPNRRLLLWIRARPILPGFRFRIHSHNKLLLLFFPLQVL